MLLDLKNIRIESLHNDVFATKKVAVDVMRLDEIHPVISGNKVFKLNYFLEEAIASQHRTILTFGGAWSNHLHATSFACQKFGLKSIGIVRGEVPLKRSFALEECQRFGMQLKYIARDLYARKDDPAILDGIRNEFGDCVIVPEGGFDAKGVKGASMIMDLTHENTYTHVACAIGTATTVAGLLSGAVDNEIILGVPVLKGMNDIDARIHKLTNGKADINRLQIIDGYHFGGYAKFNSDLIKFINGCWEDFRLPLDFVYTAKMMSAIFDRIKNDQFPGNSRVLCLHTGGLAGNRSLPKGLLRF